MRNQDERVDIKENLIKKLDDSLLSVLLKDHSSGKNIIWATDNYEIKGAGYESYSPITVKAITGRHGNVIKPRVGKSKKEQLHRVKDKAEVFTPSWICNRQNNLIDDEWFGRKNVFNVENDRSWQTVNEKIIFPQGKTWRDYVKSNRMEISCGEAPYICSRYDTVSGLWIDLKDRIGILDRKIRVVNENTESEEEWLKWVKEAYKSTYGFEWQGDSLLIARENLLYTFIDYYEGRFNISPNTQMLTEIAKIISWNIFQMDGLKFVIPNSCKPIPKLMPSIFDIIDGTEETLEECEGCKKNDPYKHFGIYAKIMDWNEKRSLRFVDLLEEK